MLSIKYLILYPLLTLILLFVQNIHAYESLFSEDFQSGNADKWKALGDGNISLSTYQENTSLRLTKKSMAITGIKNPGSGTVSIGGAFAALDLEKEDACILETTLNGGKSWTEILRVMDGGDDGLTLHTNSITKKIDSSENGIFLRARVHGNADNDTCWLDNVFIAWIPQDFYEQEIKKRILTSDFLKSDKKLNSPVQMIEFSRPGSYFKTKNIFHSKLSFQNKNFYNNFMIHKDEWSRIKSVGEPIKKLPPFSVSFIHHKQNLIPIDTGFKISSHPYWEISFQAGVTWQEESDNNWSRASVPFALQERAANCTHNGVMTWLFNNEGDISRIAYQISNETCAYFKFDMWGTLTAETKKNNLSVSEINNAKIRFELNKKNQFPIFSLSDLNKEYKNIDANNLAIGDGISPTDLSVYGLVVDGKNFRSHCVTRYGLYPFCDEMALPSYSTAKSIYAGLGLMHLETIKPGTAKKYISEIIKECNKKSWRDVSIEDALDMATGHFDSSIFPNDEDSTPHMNFIFDEKHQSKINFACTNFKRKSAPQKKFIYHTSDTYLVGNALSKIINDEEKNNLNVYDQLLVDPIWKKLNLSPLLDHTKHTYDDYAQPFAGYGLTYQSDDIIRIADWLLNGNGEIEGKNLLDLSMLNASLQRNPSDRGLIASGENYRYNNGFWAVNVAPTIECKKDVWVPFMSGFGGITVAMFPNNIIYYYFSDNYAHRWQTAIKASHNIRNLCK